VLLHRQTCPQAFHIPAAISLSRPVTVPGPARGPRPGTAEPPAGPPARQHTRTNERARMNAARTGMHARAHARTGTRALAQAGSLTHTRARAHTHKCAPGPGAARRPPADAAPLSARQPTAAPGRAPGPRGFNPGQRAFGSPVACPAAAGRRRTAHPARACALKGSAGRMR
jgi:hypothetical protein